MPNSKCYNLTRYNIGNKVIVGRNDDGYPWLEGEIIDKAPRLVKLYFEDTHYFGRAQERWLPAEEWWVISLVPN